MIATGYGNSGDAHDFYAWDAAGKVWSVVASDWVEWVDLNFADYRIAAAEIGTTGRFEATLPDGIVAYDMRFRGADLSASYLVYADAASHGLTAGQQASLAAIEDKTGHLTSNTEVVVITGDLTLGEDICLYQGQDRTDAVGAPLRLVDTGGAVLPDDATPLVLRAVHHRPGGDSFDADGVVAVEGSDKVAIVQVPGSLHATIDRGDYSYFVFKVVSGNLIALKVVGDLSLKLGPGVYSAG